MNLALLKTALSRYGFDSSDPLAIWLNGALGEFEQFAEWPFLYSTENLTTISGVSILTLPTDFVKPVSIRDTDENEPLEYLSPVRWENEILDPESVGPPNSYTIRGTDLLIYPVPDYAANLRLVYRRSVTEMEADTDEPDIPARHHYTLVRGAAYIALQAENEEERALTAQGQWQADLDKASEFYSVPQLGEAQAVADIMGYGDDT